MYIFTKLSTEKRHNYEYFCKKINNFTKNARQIKIAVLQFECL